MVYGGDNRDSSALIHSVLIWREGEEGLECFRKMVWRMGEDLREIGMLFKRGIDSVL